MLKSVLRKIPYKLRIISLFFLLSMMHLYPMLKNFFTMLPYGNNGDISLGLTILISNIQRLIHLQFGQIYHLPFLFPQSYTLTIGVALFGQSVLLLPAFLFGIPNLYPLYNGIIVFSYIAAGYGAYLFFQELLEDETVSIISAGLYILLPYRVYNIAHLNLLFNFPAPLCFLYLLRYLKNDRKKDLVLLNVFWLSQFLFDLSLGFFLSISLGLFWLIYVLMRRPVRLRSTGWLVASLLPMLGVIILVHVPFLQKEISLSPCEPNFNPAQYLRSLSFYANKSTLLLLMNRLWNPLPLFPGFAVVFFYFFAFSSHVSNLRDKILLAVMVGSYAIPGLIAVVLFREGAVGRIEPLMEICLLIFFGALASLTISAGKKIPWPLKLVSFLLLGIIFISFRPFPKIFDLFNALASVFPFLHRSRELRTLYILPLWIIGLFAFGLKAFLEKTRNKKVYLWAILLILLLEHFRWPVTMAKLPESNADAKKIYRMADPYPDHFGILELPFLLASANTYSLMTQFHNKHTYHGYFGGYSGDPLGLKGEKGLHIENALAGLADPDLMRKFKDNGLYLIVINGSFIRNVYGGDQNVLWRKIRQNVLRGQQMGLVKEIKEQPSSILIVLDDGQHGREIDYRVPYFAIAGRKAVHYQLQTTQPTRSRISVNGRLIAVKDYPTGRHETSLDIQTAQKYHQINRIQISNDVPVSVSHLLIK